MHTPIPTTAPGAATQGAQPFSICIGRQLGSGGRAIGHLLAERLGLAYYDREIMSRAAAESGFCTEVFERADEKKSLFRAFLGGVAPFFGSSEGLYANQLSDESLFRLQAEAIRTAAAERSCVFIGRCADYVLRDMPRCVSVFVAADPDDRVSRICQHDACDRKTALRLMETGDRERAAFYNFYSAGTWGAASTYDLCINSSRLGAEATADVIERFVLDTLERRAAASPAAR